LVIENQERLNFMQETNIRDAATKRAVEARYAYYRRCQVFRKNGDQCKAPAEKGAHICYAHAGAQAMAFRRKLELTIVLAEMVRRMRLRGRPEFEIADIFKEFNAIQVTLGVMAQAIIAGRIDCKTAGRLAVGLQTAAKLLRLHHRVHGETQREQNALTTKDTKEHKGRSGDLSSDYRGTFQTIEKHKIVTGFMRRTDFRLERAHAPPEWGRAA